MSGTGPTDDPNAVPEPAEREVTIETGGAAAESSPETSPESSPAAEPGSEPQTDGRADPAATVEEQAHPDPTRWDRFVDWWGGQEPVTPRQRARAKAIRRGTIVGGALVLVGSLITLPLIILGPGPTYNTIGEVDGVPMITITGTTTYPTDGTLDMTTVSERGGSSGGVHLGEALLGWWTGDDTIVPRETIYGPQTTGAEVAARNDQMFALSQSDAIAAAMNELGIETTASVVVTTVEGGAPADGIINAGDVVVAVDGTDVSTPAEVGSAVREHEVGQTVTLDLLRTDSDTGDREPVTVEVVTAANPDAAAEDPSADPVPYLGIGVGIAYEAPFDIEFSLQHVGGPSAGTMFSLAIIDMLTEGSMTGGGNVAGTGTIDPTGSVGAIGGIAQKMIGAQHAGAELFLAPASNCADVVGHEPDGMTVVPVATLHEARETVQTWAADHSATFPTCADVLADTGAADAG